MEAGRKKIAKNHLYSGRTIKSYYYIVTDMRRSQSLYRILPATTASYGMSGKEDTSGKKASLPVLKHVPQISLTRFSIPMTRR